MRTPAPPRRATLREFLAGNPFPHPFTEGFFYREKMRAIHRVAPEAPPRDVLEVGGGQSGLARMLYPGARVTVLDMDAAYADSPVNRHPDVTFVHGDATRLPFADDSFDAVTFLDVLEHIPDDAAAVAEARRVTRPGGHIVVSSPNERWRSPYHRVMRPICPTDEDMIERWGHVRRGYAIADYVRLFGAPPDVRADFINRVTVVNHDLAFSKLPDRVRRRLLALLSPVTWLGYWLQPRGARGTETAASWRVPA
jgi:SAM-dependent methyltransferase